MSAGFHRNQRQLNISQAFVNAGSAGPESTSIDDFAVFVEGAAMAPDVPKVDSNRDPDPRASTKGTAEFRFTFKSICHTLVLLDFLLYCFPDFPV